MAALYGRDIHRFKGALYQIALSSRVHLIVCDDRSRLQARRHSLNSRYYVADGASLDQNIHPKHFRPAA
jgi:hypothetical protein